MADNQSRSGKKDGDSFDLQEFVDSYGDRLLRSAYLLCGDEAEAQDLVQETFIQAIKSWQKFRGESAPYTWLHGILLNLSRRHRRKQQRLVYDEELLQKATLQSDPGHDMDHGICASRLADAIQKLSQEHREVIVLRFYEGMKIEEIARQTGVSNGTVKSRLHYAILRLEQLIPRDMNLFASDGTHPIGTS
jgi:RNA polymerase sigma-70 factor, ECF subfamily